MGQGYWHSSCRVGWGYEDYLQYLYTGAGLQYPEHRILPTVSKRPSPQTPSSHEIILSSITEASSAWLALSPARNLTFLGIVFCRTACQKTINQFFNMFFESVWFWSLWRHKEGARSRPGPGEGRDCGNIRSIKASFCLRRWWQEAHSPVIKGEKPCKLSPETPLWSRLGPCQSGWP